MPPAHHTAETRTLSLRAVDKGIPASVQIATQLVAAIKAGDLAVGSRLPSEATLAEQFGVSRSSVREAVSSLQFSGFLETARGARTVVVSDTAIGQGPLPGGGIRRPTELIDVFEARLLIEPEVVRQGAFDPIPAALRAAERALEGMQVVLTQAAQKPRSDLGLHRALLRSCRNHVLVEQAEALLARTDGVLWRRVRDRVWASAEVPKVWLTHHIAMANAVTRRDGDAACAACHGHLQSVLENTASQITLGARDRERLAVLLQKP